MWARHPDRFPAASFQRGPAEQSAKEITHAYKMLADYYREHGRMPPAPPRARVRNPATPDVPSRPKDAPAESGHAAARNPPGGRAASVRPGRFGWKAAALAALLVTVFYLQPTPRSQVSSREAAPSPNGAETHAHKDSTAAHSFTIGSTPGEVYAAHGVPSTIENGVWHYGMSRIYFDDGLVTRWDSHPDNPLRADPGGKPNLRAPATFARGSTRAQVRTIQGPPSRDMDSFWEYGTSRVYFSDDRVVGWEESPLSPLKIHQ
jgi:hypothetical protein